MKAGQHSLETKGKVTESIELLKAAIPNAEEFKIDTTDASELLEELEELERLKVGQGSCSR